MKYLKLYEDFEFDKGGMKKHILSVVQSMYDDNKKANVKEPLCVISNNIIDVCYKDNEFRIEGEEYKKFLAHAKEGAKKYNVKEIEYLLYTLWSDYGDIINKKAA